MIARRTKASCASVIAALVLVACSGNRTISFPDAARPRDAAAARDAAPAPANDAGVSADPDAAVVDSDAGEEDPGDAAVADLDGSVEASDGSIAPSDDATQAPADAAIVPPPPSFALDVYPMLLLACAPCHTTRAAAGLGLPDVLSAYDHLVGASRRVSETCAHPAGEQVVPGDPDASYLLIKLEGTQGEGCGDRMPKPPTGALEPLVPLTDEQVALVRAWIAAGAPE